MDSRYRRSTSRRTTFTLRLFEEDFINIASLVGKVPNEETGGNLFGLWTNYGNAVVLVATGPGKNCRRSAVSFYQDIPYMERVGNLLTNQYPLCHIGEWHSHHQLQLSKPSEGDCSTIRRNYPRGSQGFVLMIANIIHGGKVTLSPYKFSDENTAFQGGKIEVLDTKNPFNGVGEIKSAINEGRETTIRQQNRQLPSLEPRDLVERCHEGRDTSIRQQPRAIPSVETRDLVERSRHRENQPDGVYRSRSRSRSALKKHVDSSPQRSPEREHCQHNTVARTPRPPSPRESNTRRPTISRASGIRIPPPQSAIERTDRVEVRRTDHVTPSRTGPSEGQRYQVTSTATPWYDSDPTTLKETLSFIKDLSGDYDVVIKRDTSTKKLSFEFKHYYYHWIVSFPNNFPNSGTVTLNKDESVLPKVISISLLHGLEKFMQDFKVKFQNSCRCSACWSFKASQNPLSRYIY